MFNYKIIKTSLNLIILIIISVLVNQQSYKIIYDTYEIKKDKILVSFLKDEKFNEVINRLKNKCECLILYEPDVSETIRFKVFHFNTSDKVNKIDAKLRDYIKLEIKNQYYEKTAEFIYDYKSALSNLSIDNLLSKDDLKKEIEIDKFNLRLQQSRAYSQTYLYRKYIKNNDNIDIKNYKDYYPSAQLLLIINIIIVIYLIKNIYIINKLKFRIF